MDVHETRTDRWDVPLVCFGVVLTYVSALWSDFTFDDAMVIRGAQPLLTNLHRLPALFSREYFSLSHESTYRPVVTLTYVVDQQLWGLRPVGYHLQSIVWHIATVLGVYALARTLFAPRPNSRFLAWISSGLFAIHPLATETIDNASFREDALVAAFGIWAIQLSFRRFQGDWAVAALLYLLALFSKESAVVLPFLLIGAHLCRGEAGRQVLKRLGAVLSAFAAVTLFWACVRFGLLSSEGVYGAYPSGDLFNTVIRMPTAFSRAVRLFVFPWPLCADYSGVLPFRDPFGIHHAASGVFFIGYLLLTLWMWRKSRLVGFGLGWFVVALLPVSNAIPLPIPFAERFLYLPMVGLCFSTVGAADDLSHRGPIHQRAVWISASLMGLVFFGLTQRRHFDWRDNESLWTATVQHFPNAWGAYVGLGAAKDVADIPRARKSLETALSLSPSDDALPGIEADLGVLDAQEGNHARAISWFRQSLNRTKRSHTFFNLALSLWVQGESDSAVTTCLEALRLNPSSGHSYALLSLIAQEQGQMDIAASMYQRAMDRTPLDVEAIMTYARMLKSKRAP